MIGGALAVAAPDRGNRAIIVIEAASYALIVAKIKFGKVAMQVLLAAMLIDALHAALEDREKAFR
jgi:hypothetical protein